MAEEKMPPVRPGEILLEEFLRPLGISQNRLGRDLGVPAQRINEIIRGERSITVDTALRLAEYFENTPQFWLNMQIHYDLETAKVEQLTDLIRREVREMRGSRGDERMNCHSDVRAAANAVVARKGQNQFTIPEVLQEMRRQGTLGRYRQSTVRTHITSRCCANAPDHHAVTYRYFRRLRQGVYEII